MAPCGRYKSSTVVPAETATKAIKWTTHRNKSKTTPTPSTRYQIDTIHTTLTRSDGGDMWPDNCSRKRTGGQETFTGISASGRNFASTTSVAPPSLLETTTMSVFESFSGGSGGKENWTLNEEWTFDRWSAAKLDARSSLPVPVSLSNACSTGHWPPGTDSLDGASRRTCKLPPPRHWHQKNNRRIASRSDALEESHFDFKRKREQRGARPVRQLEERLVSRSHTSKSRKEHQTFSVVTEAKKQSPQHEQQKKQKEPEHQRRMRQQQRASVQETIKPSRMDIDFGVITSNVATCFAPSGSEEEESGSKEEDTFHFDVDFDALSLSAFAESNVHGNDNRSTSLENANLGDSTLRGCLEFSPVSSGLGITFSGQKLNFLPSCGASSDLVGRTNHALRLRHVGNNFLAAGRLDDALRAYVESTATYRSALGQERGNKVAVPSLFGVANIHAMSGRHGQALGAYTEALGILKQEHGSGYISSSLACTSPSSSALVGNALCIMGMLLCCEAQYRGALGCFREAIRAYRSTLGEHHANVGMVLNNMGNVYDAMGRRDRALKHYREALRVWSQAGRECLIRNSAIALNNIGRVELKEGRYEMAALAHGKAIKMLSMGGVAAVGGSSNGGYDGGSGDASCTAGVSIPVAAATGSDNRMSIAGTLNRLGIIHAMAGKKEKALEAHRGALEVLKSVLGSCHVGTVHTLKCIALLHEDLGQYQDAADTHRAIWKIFYLMSEWNYSDEEEHPELINSLANIARLEDFQQTTMDVSSGDT